MKKMTAILMAMISVFLISGIATVTFAGVEPSPFRTNVHTVISEKLLYVADGETGVSYSPIAGAATLSWKDGTRDGFFNAKAVVEEIEDADASIRLRYTFTLVAISSCNQDFIEGLWDVRRDGELVCNGCVGKAYGINGDIGNYFKLYIGDSQCYDEKWHLSGYITDRCDF